MKDTQSQSTYEDFAVKDIPINEQNDYIRSSKETSSTYTIDKDFVVKDIIVRNVLTFKEEIIVFSMRIF